MNYNIGAVSRISLILEYLAINESNRVKLSTGHTIRMDETGNLFYVCWDGVGEESGHAICANEITYGQLYDESDAMDEENMKEYAMEVSMSRTLRKGRNK